MGPMSNELISPIVILTTVMGIASTFNLTNSDYSQVEPGNVYWLWMKVGQIFYILHENQNGRL